MKNKIKNVLIVLVLLGCTQSALNGMEEIVIPDNARQTQDNFKRSALQRFAQSMSTHALFVGVKTQCLGLIHTSIKAGAEVNAQDATGSTPLHYAAYYLNFDILKGFLVAKNVNPTLHNNEGYTPLAIAIKRFNRRMFKRSESFREKHYNHFKSPLRQDGARGCRTEWEARHLFYQLYGDDLRSKIKPREAQELTEFDFFLNCLGQLDSAQFPYEPEEQVTLNDARKRIFALDNLRRIYYANGKVLK